MTKLIQRMRRTQAFTLVELMIVVTIVAILALIAIPLYSANTTAAIMSEGVSGCGTNPDRAEGLLFAEQHLRRRHASDLPRRARCRWPGATWPGSTSPRATTRSADSAFRRTRSRPDRLR